MSINAYITAGSRFLPNNPVENDDMETYLGLIDHKTSKAKNIVLRNNGIKKRYYALDKYGKSTHTNAEMTRLAIEGLKQALDNDLNNIDLLCCGTTSADQLLPSHACMVLGELKIRPVDTMSPSGSCLTGIQGLHYAFLNILTGRAHNAVCTGSERMSSWLTSPKYNGETDYLHAINENPYIGFDKEFLRWMLSDGAAALLVQSQPKQSGVSLRIDWMELRSYANENPTCMYAGADKNADGKLISFSDMEPHEWVEHSVFSLKQDVKLLSERIVPIGGEYLKELCVKHNMDIKDIDYFLPHISSQFFGTKIAQELDKIGLHIPGEKWFTNLQYTGNVGSASILLKVEELLNSGKLQKGQRLLLMVPESARFSYAYAHLTVV